MPSRAPLPPLTSRSPEPFTRLVDVYQTWLGAETATHKAANMCFTPVTTYGGAGAANGYLDAIKSFIAAGSKRFSTFDRAGQAELLERLQETLGINNSFQGASFNRAAFDQYNLILAYDLEMAGNHAKGTGMNLSHGQLLTVQSEAVGALVITRIGHLRFVATMQSSN